MRPIILFFSSLCVIGNLFAQQIVPTGFAPLDFGGAGVTITPKVGNGTAVGDIVVYENILTISGQQVDAIVTTAVLQNGSFSDYDNISTSQGNLERWFSPRLSFNNGGGSVHFNFQFIEGASFNNGTNTGTPLILADVMLNTYDIDGNGNAGTNQYVDFESFDLSEIGNPTTLAYSYNAVTGLTRFLSTSSANNGNAASEETRVRCTYSSLSTIDVVIGSQGSGAAYFFLDFSSGASFTTASSMEVPTLDLNTYTVGLDNDSLFISTPVSFTKGLTNITYSVGLLEQMTIQFDGVEILDGASELLVFGNSGVSLPLNFSNGATLPVVTVGGIDYSITLMESAGRSTIIVERQGGSQTSLNDMEFFLDELHYNNLETYPAFGDRNFDVRVIDGSLGSPVARFTVEVSTYLPVELVSFDYNCETSSLHWETASELNSSHFEIWKSDDMTVWNLVDKVNAAGNSQLTQKYQLPIGKNLYNRYVKLIQVDFNGEQEEFNIRYINCDYVEGTVLIYPNPFSNALLIESSGIKTEDLILELYKTTGMKVYTVKLERHYTGCAQLDVSELEEGVYTYVIRGSQTVFQGRIVKSK